ncbi:MAG: hypothetical protein IPM63_04245 [Acidobacteriota bacterium]|nr:MAG: hypothetical protein IPM63_04245 [Acidobacteriota bacterium]
MRYTAILTAILITAFFALPANGQIGDLAKKIKSAASPDKKAGAETGNAPEAQDVASQESPDVSDDEFLFVGANGLEGASIGGLRSCSETNDAAKRKLGPHFKQWIDQISPTAQLKMFEKNRCELMGFQIVDRPERKYKKPGDLAEMNQGRSIYKVASGKLVLVESFAAPEQYVVVVPEVAKEGLALKDLNLCVNPEKKDHYRRLTGSATNCHDTTQKLYVFEKYKMAPGDLQTNSSLFNASDFDTLNKQGKFKGLKIYRLVGQDLEPVN